MSKHRFPPFTGEETKLCKTYLLIQGLVRVKKGEAQPAGPWCPYIMVAAVRWGFKVAEERGGCSAAWSLDFAAYVMLEMLSDDMDFYHWGVKTTQNLNCPCQML